MRLTKLEKVLYRFSSWRYRRARKHLPTSNATRTELLGSALYQLEKDLKVAKTKAEKARLTALIEGLTQRVREAS